MLYRLIVLTGPLKNQRITVDREPMTIGRAPDSQIVLPDDEVAPKHAVLEHKPDDGLYINDLGTMHRIIVNGRELRHARLKHGDMVEIGRTRFLVQAIVAADVSGLGLAHEDKSKGKVVAIAAIVMVLAVITWMRWPQTHPNVKPPKAEPEPPVTALAQTNVPNIPPAVETAAAQTNAPVPPPAASNIVIAKIETNAPPVEISKPASVAPAVAFDALGNASQATQMTAEIRRMREDLTAMHERIKDLSRPPMVVTAMPQVVVVTAAPPPMIVVTSIPPPVFTSPAPIIVITTTPPTIATSAPAKEIATVVDTAPPSNLPARPPPVAITNLPVEQSANVAQSTATDRVIRVLAVEQSRFQSGDDFDDMRTLNVTLSQMNPHVDIRNADVRLEISFFDEDLAAGVLHASRSVGPIRDLRPTQPWGSDRRCSVSATYVLPKGQLAKNKAEGHDERYYGFVVRIFYRDILQDEWAAPRSLLKLSPETGAANDAAAKPAP